MEPWLRGTLRDVPAVGRSVIHALELAAEDVRKWCTDLTDAEMAARPLNLPAVSFQLRHMARSVDRLLTYAEGGQLNTEQLAALGNELAGAESPAAVRKEFEQAIAEGVFRVRALCALDLEAQRFVGRGRLPSTLGGLLVHVAEHTARHVGQAVTTAKVVVARRPT